MGEGEQDAFDVLWENVLSDWNNGKVHDAFVHMAGDLGELGRAAVCYRGQFGVPERREVAQARMSALLVLASQGLEVGRSQRQSTSLWVLWVAFALCVLGIWLFVWVLAS